MNRDRSQLQIVEKALRMIAIGRSNAREIAIPSEEFDRCCDYLLESGFVTTGAINEHGSLLRLTVKGDALLCLIDGIDALGASDGEEAIVEYGEEAGAGLPSQVRANTIECRDRVYRAYILEQAEMTRLAAQLSDIANDEGELELEYHQRRLNIYRNLLEALEHLVRDR